MYLVSILVPVYKVEGYIERCARSLFEQTYSNLEFVFVDDCSPDKSVEVLERIMNNYPARKESVRIVCHEHNRGLAASRNTALDNATGAFVCAVDSDDWLELDAIEKLVNRQIETSADIVAGNMIMHAKDGDKVFMETSHRCKEDLVLLQLQKGWDHTVARKLIRRSLYEDNGIRCIEGCDMTEDRYQMAHLTYFAESYAQIDDVIYHYDRRNEGSIMSQIDKDKVLGRNYQYLRNWYGIRDFFSDKEPVYYKEATEQTMLFAKEFLTFIIKRNSKEWYNRLASILDKEDKSNQELVGWYTKGIRGVFCHSFFLREADYQRQRVIRYIKRLFCEPAKFEN